MQSYSRSTAGSERRGTGYRHAVRLWSKSTFTGKSHKLVIPAQSPHKKFIFVVAASHLRAIADGFVRMPEGKLFFGFMSTPGADAIQLRTEFINATLPRKPDAICLMAPSNNLTSRKTIASAQADFRKLLLTVSDYCSNVFVLDFPSRLNIDGNWQDAMRQGFRRESALMAA